MRGVLNVVFGVGVIIGGPVFCLISIIVACAIGAHIVHGTISAWWLFLFVPAVIFGFIMFSMWFSLANFLMNPPSNGR